MPRSSRHKSHRSHKHGSRDGRDRSDSEDDGNSRERKPRGEEPAAGPGPRVSRDAEPEKRKSLSSSQLSQGKEKDLMGTSNGDFSGEHGKKRKDRAEDPVVGDRWIGGGEDDHMVDKKSKGDGFEPGDLDKTAKSKLSAADSKSRSSRRREGSSEKNEDSGSRVESVKRRSEKESKDLSQRESGNLFKDAKERDRDHCKDAKERDRDYYKDAKERDRDYHKDVKERDTDYHKDAKERDRDYSKDARERDRDYSKDAKERDRERGSERDKKVQDARHERSDDAVSRKHVSNISGSEEERLTRKDMEIAEWQVQDDLRSLEVEKELGKRIRRRDSSGDKCLGDGTDSDDRRLSSRDDRTKNGSYKDESHKEERYRDKYREDLDRDQRHCDDRGRDERSSRDQNSNRSVNKHFRDENKPSESHKKIKIQDSHHDGSPYVDVHGTKLKDNRGRKKFSDDDDDRIDLKAQSAKEPCEDVEKIASCTSKFDSHTDRARLDYLHPDKVDSSPSNNRPKSSPSSRPKNSPSSSNHAVMGPSRPNSKQVGSSCRKSLSEETLRPSAASRGDPATVSEIRERVSEPRLVEKTQPKDSVHSDELLVEVVASHNDRTPKSDAHTSPNPLAEKSSSSTSDRRFSDRTGAKRSLDIERQKNSSSKDGRDSLNTKDRERALPSEKSISISHELSQAELLGSEPFAVGPSSFNRTGHFSGSSPSHLPPSPPVRHGIDSPSVLGSYEDENRVQLGDRKPNSRYKRSGEQGMGRGQGNAWKSAPTWSSPVANGFIPLQHGPPPPGFHPAVQQFPAPPLFGVRSSMDLNHTHVSYHVHEAADRFSSHGRPFGWHNPVEDCPPHLQVWDGSNGVFGDESHSYGRSEWDMNRHLMGSRGWEMSADMWKGQNGNVNMELPVPQESDYSGHTLSDEAWVGQTGHRSRTERAQSEHLPADNSEIKRLNDKSPAKNAVETPQKSLHEKAPESSKTPSVPEMSKTKSDDNSPPFRCNYLSKLDISLDLVQPELYKQCMPLLETRDMTSVYNVSKSGQAQNAKEEARVATKSTNHVLNSLFPTTIGAVFQRAILLYKKQNEGRKEMFPASPAVCPEEKSSSEASEAEEVKGVDNQTASADTSLAENVKAADNQTSAYVSLANANSASNIGEERKTTTEPQVSHPGDAMEEQSDSISDAAHFVEGSESCEALMPECRVNLSRIHLSPGSTH